MRGIEVKLCRGGGQLVAHSNEPPYPHGSSVFTSGALRVIQILSRKGIVEKASRNAPTVEIMFMPVKPSLAR